MVVACLFVPHFALRVALVERPDLDGRPLLLGPAAGGRPLVADATPEALVRGVRPGMALREAMALCPEAIALVPRQNDADAIAERLLQALEELSPLVEPGAGASGCCYVDLRGSERLLGPPAVVAERLLATAPPLLRPRVGIAPNRFAAWVAAQNAPPGGSQTVRLAELAALLAPAAIGLLPLPPETVRRLERLGLRTLGDLAALPPAAVQARFGAQGRRMWELASGRDDTPVTPRRRPETVSEWLDLPAPAISREAFLFALRRLVLTAIAQPTLRGRAARQARVRVFLESGGVWEKEVTLREPAAGERLSEALRLRFGAVSLPGPVVSLALALSGLTAEAARQATIAGAFPRRPNALAEAAQQLAARYGASPLYRIVEVEPWSRIPERRHALIAFEP